MPPDMNGQYPPISDYLTYTNSMVVNKTVLVPIYNLPQDTTAVRIYRENMPGYKIVGFDCNQIIPASGAIHCITKEIGSRDPVLIYHASLQNTADTINNYVVNANIKNSHGIDSAFMYWTLDTSTGYGRILMTNTGGQNWAASIPHQSAGKSIYYYIRSKTSIGKYFSKPITAPRGFWKFSILNSTGISNNETNVPYKIILYQNYPNPFNPITRIKFFIPPAFNRVESSVILSIFDVNGRKILTLVNKRLKSGNYEYIFDGSNISSGVYFYRFIADGFSQTKAMVLIK